MKKSILIDATHYQKANPTGVELYVDGLLAPLVRLLAAQSIVPVLLGHTAQPPGKLPEGVRWHHAPHRRM